MIGLDSARVGDCAHAAVSFKGLSNIERSQKPVVQLRNQAKKDPLPKCTSIELSCLAESHLKMLRAVSPNHSLA